MSLLLHDERDEVRVAEALPDRGGLRRRRVCRFVVGAGVRQHLRDQEVAALHALAALALEQPLGPAEPPVRARRVAPEQQPQAGPERAPHRRARRAGIEVSLIGPLQRVQILVVATEHVRRLGEQAEVLAAQRGRLVGHREPRVRAFPRPPRVQSASSLERVACAHGCRHLRRPGGLSHSTACTGSAHSRHSAHTPRCLGSARHGSTPHHPCGGDRRGPRHGGAQLDRPARISTERSTRSRTP